MKNLKDIFYDLNDILVALIIITVAAFTIVANIDSILNYPASIAAEIAVPEEELPTDYAENPTVGDQNGGDAGNEGSGDGNVQGTTEAGIDDPDATAGGTSGNEGTAAAGEALDYSVYINYGQTGDQIADVLISVGLLRDRQQFYDAVAAAGAEGKLQAGNFIIPSDATPAEIVSIITN
ncbi:MAG: hypothetical protein PHC91_09240 [Eubacteriales bacterium]|nr:hypothetical protein [Eubacteriales bacterium]